MAGHHLNSRSEDDPVARKLCWRATDLADSGRVQEGIRLLRKAASRRYEVAFNLLGHFFEEFVDPPQPRKATYWYKRAVDLGYSISAWNLAMHHRNRGATRWYLYWLRKAADMGEEDAIAVLSSPEALMETSISGYGGAFQKWKSQPYWDRLFERLSSEPATKG